MSQDFYIYIHTLYVVTSMCRYFGIEMSIYGLKRRGGTRYSREKINEIAEKEEVSIRGKWGVVSLIFQLLHRI